MMGGGAADLDVTRLTRHDHQLTKALLVATRGVRSEQPCGEFMLSNSTEKSEVNKLSDSPLGPCEASPFRGPFACCMILLTERFKSIQCANCLWRSAGAKCVFVEAEPSLPLAPSAPSLGRKALKAAPPAQRCQQLSIEGTTKETAISLESDEDDDDSSSNNGALVPYTRPACMPSNRQKKLLSLRHPPPLLRPICHQRPRRALRHLLSSSASPLLKPLTSLALTAPRLRHALTLHIDA